MAINNFKRLHDEPGRGPGFAPPEIERNVKGNVGLIEFIGNIIELYLPKVLDVFFSVSGAPGRPENNARPEGGVPGEIDPNNDGIDPNGGAVSDNNYR